MIDLLNIFKKNKEFWIKLVTCLSKMSSNFFFLRFTFLLMLVEFKSLSKLQSSWSTISRPSNDEENFRTGLDFLLGIIYNKWFKKSTIDQLINCHVFFVMYTWNVLKIYWHKMINLFAFAIVKNVKENSITKKWQFRGKLTKSKS